MEGRQRRSFTDDYKPTFVTGTEQIDRTGRQRFLSAIERVLSESHPQIGSIKPIASAISSASSHGRG